MKEQVYQFLRESSYRQYADEVIKLLKPSVRIQPQLEAGLSHSHFGGRPDVPPSFSLPAWDARLYWESQLQETRADQYMAESYRRDRITQLQTKLSQDTVEPLTYLGQIHLRELSSIATTCGLPSDGVLLFFYDLINYPGGYEVSSKGAWRCVYLDATEELAVKPISKNEYKGELFPHCSLSFEEEWMISLPGPELKDVSEDIQYWQRLIEVLKEEFGIRLPTVACSIEHRLLGYDGPMQEPMERLCQLRFNGISGYAKQSPSIEKGVEDWQLLLQIDSDDKVGWEFGDTGRLYFWIRQQDLAKHDFSKIWCEMQCA
nr:YwqG family protein [cf. Phormidesmis sp. LEGE 11477]